MLVTANIFQPLIDVFAAVIKFFHGNVGLSWGWSIVLLTVCVRLVLVPLTVKQFSSMRKLQHLQPQMKEIQRKYKDDKQRQQEEMMKFYRENEVNPLASCLPLVAQLPVFVSLFYMLRKNLRTDICPGIQTAFQKHYATTYMASHHVGRAAAHAASLSQTTACGAHAPGAGFLFINDITNTAHGVTLVVLLILYVGTQVLSTFLMSAPTMDKSQRNMMMVMPVIFVLFIIRFPAGLIVYWITTNTWTMAQQFTLKQLMGHAPPPVVAGAGGGSASSGGAGAGGGGGLPSGSGGGKGPRSGGGAGKAPEIEEEGSSGGLGGLRKRFAQVKEDAQAEAQRQAEARRAAAPPPPPRKKRKRSGRRR